MYDTQPSYEPLLFRVKHVFKLRISSEKIMKFRFMFRFCGSFGIKKQHLKYLIDLYVELSQITRRCLLNITLWKNRFFAFTHIISTLRPKDHFRYFEISLKMSFLTHISKNVHISRKIPFFCDLWKNRFLAITRIMSALWPKYNFRYFELSSKISFLSISPKISTFREK